jgi:hypothetical protein
MVSSIDGLKIYSEQATGGGKIKEGEVWLEGVSHCGREVRLAFGLPRFLPVAAHLSFSSAMMFFYFLPAMMG